MKKRIIAMILCAATLLAVLSATASAVELPVVPLNPTVYNPCGPGDVDGNGKINAKDVVALMRFLVGTKPRIFFKRVADFNEDTNINAKDVTALMRYIVRG